MKKEEYSNFQICS